MAAVRFFVEEVNPEYGNETDGTFTYVQVSYTSSDVLWGDAPYESEESGTYYFSFVVPGGTVTWDTSAPLFDTNPDQFYPGESYLGLLYHGEWDASPMLRFYRKHTSGGKSVYLSDAGRCLAEFDSTDGPVTGAPVSLPLPIYGPLWGTERLEIDADIGPAEDSPDDEGDGYYPDNEDDQTLWGDNFDNCPTAATIDSEVASALSSYSPDSTTFEWLTNWEWYDGVVTLDDTASTTSICWVAGKFPYSCEDPPEWPERPDAALSIWDESDIEAWFPLDDIPGNTLADARGGGDATVYNEANLDFLNLSLNADQGTSVEWPSGSNAYADLGTTRWNFVHNTAVFTVLATVAWPAPSATNHPVVASSQSSTHRGFRVDTGTGKIRGLLTNGTTNRSLVGSTILQPDTTYTVAFVGNGTNLYLYLNGVQEATASAITAAGNATHPLRIGRHPTTLLYNKGTIDDLIILDVAASSQEIADYHALVTQRDQFDLADTTDMSLWLDASVTTSMWKNTARTQSVTTDGDSIQAIDDLSGAGNHLTFQTTAPTYWAGKFNHQPTTSFVGGNDEWRNSSVDKPTPQTVVFVGRNDGTSYGHVVTSGTGTAMRVPLVSDTAASTGIGPGFYDGSYTPYEEHAVTWEAVYVVVFGSDNVAHFYLDGHPVGDGESYTSWTNNASLFRIGGAGTSPDFDLSELRVYDRALDAREIESLSHQLRHKWGVF